MNLRRLSLGRDFSLLWAGQTVSDLGTQVTTLALPTVAILSFNAGAATTGLLLACNRLAFPVLALVAGAVVDRVAKRPLMIACNLLQFITVGSIPLLAVQGALQLWMLFVVAVLMGVLSVFYDIAYLAIVPSLVGTERLLPANRRLESTLAAASLAGPGLGGLLIQLFGAARAMLADSASYLVSAFMLLNIRHRETAAQRPRARLRTEIATGLRHVFGHPVLRAQILCMSAAGIFAHAFEGPLYVFAYERLQMSPATLGAIFVVEGAGSLAGIAVVNPVMRRLGAGPSVALADAAAIACTALLPLALVLPPAPVFAVALFAAGGLGSIGNIAQVTVRQSLSPTELQGRMTSIFRAFFWGAWPLGNLIGGLLATAVGAPLTIWIMASMGVLFSLSIRLTPLWRVLTIPTTNSTTAVPGATEPALPVAVE